MSFFVALSEAFPPQTDRYLLGITALIFKINSRKLGNEL